MKVHDVVTHFGSQASAASAIGRTQPTISNWLARAEIPHEAQIELWYVTKGSLKPSRQAAAWLKKICGVDVRKAPDSVAK